MKSYPHMHHPEFSSPKMKVYVIEWQNSLYPCNTIVMAALK